MLAVGVFLLAPGAGAAGLGGLLGGGSFKATNYPECHAPIASAREVVEPPPVDYAGKAQAAGRLAGAASRIPGLGGLGALGSVGAAASTASQVATYSSWIGDAAAFASSMRETHPVYGERLGAYGSRIDEDAAQLDQAAVAAVEAQRCYETAYDELVVGIEAGDVSRRARSRRYKEITGGLDLTSELLIDARNRLNANVVAYDSALAEDTAEAGVDLDGLFGLASQTGLADGLYGGNAAQVALANCGTAAFDSPCARATMAQVSPPNYGVAQELALTGAMYSGNGAAAVGALGAASAATSAFASYQTLTSDGREAPICAGLDDGRALMTCLRSDGATTEPEPEARYALHDLASLGVLARAGDSRATASALVDAAAGLAQSPAGTADAAVVGGLIDAGATGDRYFDVNRGLNAADREQARVVEKTSRRPW